MKLYCYYHDNCWDGFVAAWLVRKHCRRLSAGTGDGLFYYPRPFKYGEEVLGVEAIGPVAGDTLYFVDICPPPEELESLGARFSVLVFDHHKSSIEAVNSYFFGKRARTFYGQFDEKQSGAGIVWRSLFASEPMPNLVAYVEDRDLWKFALPFSKEVNEYIRSCPFDFDTVDWLDTLLGCEDPRATASVDDVVRSGSAMLQAKRRAVEIMADNYCTLWYGKVPIPAANASIYFSDVAHELAVRFPEAPFAAYYFDRKDGKRQWGLASLEKGLDVSEIAKQYGGGGHRHVSGFTMAIGAFPKFKRA